MWTDGGNQAIGFGTQLAQSCQRLRNDTRDDATPSSVNGRNSAIVSVCNQDRYAIGRAHAAGNMRVRRNDCVAIHGSNGVR